MTKIHVAFTQRDRNALAKVRELYYPNDDLDPIEEVLPETEEEELELLSRKDKIERSKAHKYMRRAAKAVRAALDPALGTSKSETNILVRKYHQLRAKSRG